MDKVKGKKIFVGMSGGVDSSVSALLLKQEGYDVTGVFIKVWQPDFVECTWKEDRLDAMRVCAQLEIPFVTLDLEKEYKREVIDYMIDEYKVGRTPNPDVMCNRYVKFGAFWDWAKDNGADFIATGHYANTDNQNLIVSKDKNKDQTYFLWTLNKNDLEHILFPIGNMEKSKVRKIAEKNNIYTSHKKDSQGLCFIGTIDIKDFLKSQIESQKGNIVNENGNVIGHHEGVIFYTIGERHGFTITEKSTEEKPYFIVAKDFENNLLVVSHHKPEEKVGDEFEIEKVNFVNDRVEEEKTYSARARYRAPLSKIKIRNENGKWIVKKVEGDLVPVSGQSLVIYDNEKCIGGGIIL